MNHAAPLGALPLARALISCPSVTPDDAGAQALLAASLALAGFTVTELPFGATRNLFARAGTGRPHLCFAGHTDVVPAGDGAWSVEPFGAQVHDGRLYGRGACDMKGAVAAFAAAAAARIATGLARGSISLLITGDEEGDATDGTVRVVEWLRETDQVPDFCLVGEPTNPAVLGDAIKIGRRGSLNAAINVHGRQGHAAYPERADNPVHRLLALLGALVAHRLDDGTAHFAPSSLQVTTVDVGNPATNVIPAAARASLNIRFNDRHTGSALRDWLLAETAAHAPGADIAVRISGEPFLSAPARETDALARAVESVTGRRPAYDTGGGTSDARFLAPLCPVAEFGLVGASMHAVDEHVDVADLEQLTRIYAAWLEELLR